MLPLLLLLLVAALLPEPVCSSLEGSRFLAGVLGGSITHQCFYSTTLANQRQRKYWCKVAADGACYTLISSSSSPRGQYRGRVALGDVPQNGTFTVTMTGLRSSDSGTYRCGIGNTNHGLYVSLNLTVLPEATAPRPTQLIRGELHGSVTVLCPSGDTQSDQERFWCKVGRSRCTLLATSGGYVGTRYQGRVVLTPRDSSGAFRVLMNGLKEEDSGLYLCGTRGLSGQDSSQEVVLQVAAASALPRRPKFLSGTVGGSLSFQCHHGLRGPSEERYLCRWKAGSCQVLLGPQGSVPEPYRGRLRLSHGHPQPGSFTVLLGPLREQDAGWYWCGARSGLSEHTAPLKLLIHKGTGSSWDPGTATAPSPAAHGTARPGSVGGVMGTVPRGTRVGSVTDGTRVGSVTHSTTLASVTHSSSSLLPTATSARPGTSASSSGEGFQESSSGEPRLLPVLLPALLLLICFTITILTLAKIKLQKQTGGEGSATGSREPSPGGEERTEQSPRAGAEPGFRRGTGSCGTISGILGNIRMSSFYLPYGEKMLLKVADEDLSQNLL